MTFMAILTDDMLTDIIADAELDDDNESLNYRLASLPLSFSDTIRALATELLDRRRINLCANCDKVIYEDEGVLYHDWSGIPPCNPEDPDPEALLDVEGDKYPIATRREINA